MLLPVIVEIGIMLLLIKGADLAGQHYNREPPRKATRAFMQTVQSKKSVKNRIEEELVMPIARQIVAPWIRLEERSSLRWQMQLTRAALPWSPQEYLARGITITLLVLAAIFLVFPIVGLTGALPLGICITGLLAYHQFTMHVEILKKKQKSIIRGLPGFVRIILFKLREAGHSPDLIHIFETYLQIANPAFEYDVSKLVVDLKSQNAELALRNFANRIELPDVTRLSNILIGITRGENQEIALERLAADMDLQIHEALQRELDKRPMKVRRPTLCLVIVAFFVLGYVVFTSLVQEMGYLF